MKHQTPNTKHQTLIFSLTILLVSFLLSFTAAAEGFGMERIHVYGTPNKGTSVVFTCYSADCLGAALDLAKEIEELFKKQTHKFVETDEIKSKFCTKIKKKAPSSCYSFAKLNGKPEYFQSNPVFWKVPPISNGCGTGSYFEAGVSELMTKISGPSFSGDVNEPLKGLNFVDPCNNHDICYANNTSQASCDLAFQNEMDKVCNGNYDCETMSMAYASAVRLFGEKAFNKAKEQQTCRVFKGDYSRNCSFGGIGV